VSGPREPEATVEAGRPSGAELDGAETTRIHSRSAFEFGTTKSTSVERNRLEAMDKNPHGTSDPT
jgi:hypothetical protein